MNLHSEHRLLHINVSPEAGPQNESIEGGMEGERTLADEVDEKIVQLGDAADRLEELTEELSKRGHTEKASEYLETAKQARGSIAELQQAGSDVLQEAIDTLDASHKEGSMLLNEQ